MDVSELESNQNVIYITEEEHRVEWTYDATKELLKIYDEKSDMLDTGIISTQKKLWELTSKALAKKEYYYTAAQCENKWKALKRSYKTKLERMQKFGTTKRACPFEYEVAEILSKRPNDSFSRSYSVKIDELRRQEDLFKINLNEPPGFSKDKKMLAESDYVDIKNVAMIDEDVESPKYEYEDSEPTYTVVQDVSQSALIEELSDLKRFFVKHNKINTQLLKQTNEVQEKILDCLERTIEGQDEARRIEERKARQQSEIVQQMKIQNELLEKLIEKLG
ncbi:uncharacterized protein LOC108906928 [Anoplophora glabripennis]|uniref:uncharacterized protein LOC108906928 n=1 Tax=Anoplophora glabripennis TaxID=217634 RepID=UPI0008740A8E|nr:uncharacterized protein LOC108906928 [Anoplophora glabripennis]